MTTGSSGDGMARRFPVCKRIVFSLCFPAQLWDGLLPTGARIICARRGTLSIRRVGQRTAAAARHRIAPISIGSWMPTKTEVVSGFSA